MNGGKLERNHPEFIKDMNEVKLERVRKGVDRKFKSMTRLTLGVKRHPLWERIKSDLKIADMKEDKQGQMLNIYTFMIVAFLAVVLFAGLIYVMGLINGVMHNAGLTNEVNAGQPGYTNMTLASDLTFGKVNQSVQALRLVAFTLVFSLLIGMIVINAFVRVHPLLFFVNVLVSLLGIFLAVPISNAYETLLASNIYEGNLNTFTAVNWLLLNLPLVVAIMAILGTVFMFIGFMRNEGSIGL